MARQNSFDPVMPEHIAEAESQLGRSFPDSLKRVWLKHGAGRLPRSGDGTILTDNINSLLHPANVQDHMERNGLGGGAEFNGGIPFFEIYMDTYLMVGVDGHDDKVTDEAGVVVAEDAEDFFSHLMINPEFYHTERDWWAPE